MLHQLYWAECKWPFWVQNSPVRTISIPSPQQDMETGSFLPLKSRREGQGKNLKTEVCILIFALPASTPPPPHPPLLCHLEMCLFATLSSGKGGAPLPLKLGGRAGSPKLGQSVHCIAWATVIGTGRYTCDPIRLHETWDICWESMESPSLTLPRGCEIGAAAAVLWFELPSLWVTSASESPQMVL